MIDKQKIEAIARSHGCPDVKWLAAADVPVRQWVRFKCMFGCPSYGMNAGCPPAVPSIPECRELFGEYQQVLVLRIAARLARPEDGDQWSRRRNLELLAIERETFLAGYRKALVLFMDRCRLCEDCSGRRETCRFPEQARPCPEALGVDVFAAVRAAGFPIEVLTDCDQEMNRYALLLVE